MNTNMSEYQDQMALLLANAQRIKEIKPYKRPNKDYLDTKFKYEMQLDYQKSLTRDNPKGMAIRTNVKTKCHSSLHDLKDLKPIILKDMRVNDIHYGHYLECTTIAEAFYVTGLSLLVVDNTGEVENLMLYNYNSKSFDIEPSVLMPVNTKLIIKEPYLKLFASGNGEFGIRVDSPTDVIVLETEYDTSKSVDNLIDEANSYFQKDQFHTAIMIYSQAVHKSNNESTRALLNRAETYLKLERYYLAYKDAQLASELDNTNEKAYFQMAKAAYSMRQFDKALENFELCLKINKELKEAEIGLVDSKKRIDESKTGIYDFEAIVSQFTKKKSLHFDVADYISNRITVADIANRQKGILAKEDIKKGTLLVAAKAVSTVFKNTSNSHLTRVDINKNSYDLNDGSQNFVNIVYKMQSDPELAKQIYSLYAGPNFNREDEINKNVIDITRIEEIQKYNSFRIESHLDLEKLSKQSVVDKESGLWLYPSFFNHSCVCNSIRLFFGDLMLIYAKKDLKKDEEITVNYFGAENYSKRKESMQVYDFECDCKLCTLDASDANLKNRESLHKGIVSKRKNLARVTLNEAIGDVKLMRQTYEKRPELQEALVLPLKNLAVKYRENFNYRKSAAIFEEIYEISKEGDFHITIIALKAAYNDYKACSLSDKFNWCHKTAAEYFENNEKYFETLWAKVSLKQI